MTANTQQQQKQVMALQIQLDQHFDLYSQGNEIVFSLLTHEWNDAVPTSIAVLSTASKPTGRYDNATIWSEHWNFYAYLFSNGDYSARITNINSLVSTQSLGNGMFLLLKQLGYSETQASLLANEIRSPFGSQSATGEAQLPSLQAQQEEFVPVQHVHELSLLPGWSKELMQGVAPYVTTFNSRLFNEAYVLDDMLEMVVTTAQADIIRTMRAEGRFNPLAFETVSELYEDEFRSFSPGPDFRIEVWQNSTPDFVRVVEVRLLPLQTDAVEFRYKGWGN
jgi:hypothetical protein